MEFIEFNLHPDLQRGIADADYVTCMPVQEQVLKNAFGGQDLYVQSQTGTGKTAAYLIVIFQRLLTEPLLGGKKALIMVPTRELAVQVEQEAKVIGKYLPFKVGSFYGGVGYAHQQKLLKENAQLLVGTPGRVLDLNGSGQMNLMDLSFLILDEADRMFDMGFYPDLRKLITVVPPVDKRQTMLFSATLNAWVKNLAWEYTKTPLEIEIAPEKVTVEEIDQLLYHVPSNDKMKLVMGILEHDQPESAIIFCNTKRYAEIVAKRLRINGIECEFIIGDLPQIKRLSIIEDVKAGRVRFLVATDVAARGLDIEGLAMVINYDLPNEAENYIHRIGRTARAGKTGKAVSLASEQDVYELPAIERYLGKKIPSMSVSEDLYGQDKSDGMRIRTDVYEDKYNDRKSHGDGGGRGRRPDERHGRGDGRGDRAEPRRADRADGGRFEGRREGSRQEGPRRDRPQVSGGPPNRDTRTAAKPDLSHLPFEERMAYYKRKYETDEGQGRPAPGPKPTNPGRPPRGAQANRDSGPGGTPPKPGHANRQGRQQSADRRPRQGNQGRNPAAPAPQARPQPQNPPTAKSGIVSRILGLFRKGSKD